MSWIKKGLFFYRSNVPKNFFKEEGPQKKKQVVVFGPIWTCGLCIKSCWASFEKSFGPKKKIRGFTSFQDRILPRAIWPNLVFIPPCSFFFETSIWAYLDLWALYKIWLGPVWDTIKLQKEN